jgi:hypothetical protein
MKLPRIRLSTLMLLVVISALGIGLVLEQQMALRREIQFRLEEAKFKLEEANYEAELQALRSLHVQERKAMLGKLSESDATIDDLRKQLRKHARTIEKSDTNSHLNEH